MAATAMSLQLRRYRTNSSIGNPSSVNFFSSSSIPEPPNIVQEETTPSPPPPPSKSQSSFSSYFSDVKSSLRQRQQQQQRSPFETAPNNHFPQYSKPTPAANPSKSSSFDEIRKNLSEFRSRTAVPPPSGTGSQSSFPASLPRASPSVSFQELYKKNVMAKGDAPDTSDSTNKGKGSFEMIRQSLTQLRPTTPVDANNRNDLPNRSKLSDSLFGAPRSTPVFGGTDSLPHKVFGKESNKKAGAESAEMKTRFVKPYNYGELGERLRMLRPEEAKTKTEKWFSLKELSERLIKLREIDEKEPVSNTFTVLRESLFKLSSQDEAAKTKKSSFHRIDILGQLGGTPDYMLSPPKEHLLEKYFHPDNMSSAEKMKIELKKVRDEFKMSESDCGSARVQVAQLTTKIKHLSTTLHKKDKHSRKGLQAMVQQRKKLLKYLRRTDWDSYCLVLDKLGLRDNPDYKN